MLRIKAVEMYRVRLPLKAAFETSFGVQAERDFIIVAVEADDYRGYGEVSTLPWPGYNEETTSTAWVVLEECFVPAILGNVYDDPTQVATELGRFKGNRFAKSGLENAVWDCYSQAREASLAKVLWETFHRDGRSSPPSLVPVGVSIGIQPDIQSLVRVVGEYLERGYRRIKIKIKPGWDVEPIAALRKEYGAIPLMVDANSSYTLADLSVFRRLDDFDLMMIEQPLSAGDIIDHSRLQAHLRTPICLDESICSVEDARKALELGACRIINIKVGRVGGLTEACKIEALARQHKCPVWCGGMLESGVGRAINLAIATLPGFTLPGDTSESARYYWEDLVEPVAVLNNDGTIDVPQGHGIGVRVLEDRLRRYAVKYSRYEA